MKALLTRIIFDSRHVAPETLYKSAAIARPRLINCNRYVVSSCLRTAVLSLRLTLKYDDQLLHHLPITRPKDSALDQQQPDDS